MVVKGRRQKSDESKQSRRKVKEKLKREEKQMLMEGGRWEWCVIGRGLGNRSSRSKENGEVTVC